MSEEGVGQSQSLATEQGPLTYTSLNIAVREQAGMECIIYILAI
jgi:hypothetical protein